VWDRPFRRSDYEADSDVGAGLVPVAATALLVATGCDNADNDLSGETFQINPQQVTLLDKDTTLILRAVGSHEPFVWSVSDSSLGTVTGTARTGDLLADTEERRQHGVRGGRPPMERQRADPPGTETGTLKIEPAQATIDVNEGKAVFTATAARPPTRGAWAATPAISIRRAEPGDLHADFGR